MALAAAANDRSSATLANIASPSKSSSFDIDNPATMTFIYFYFENEGSATDLCDGRRTQVPHPLETGNVASPPFIDARWRRFWLAQGEAALFSKSCRQSGQQAPWRCGLRR
jgi:hypothetical protein